MTPRYIYRWDRQGRKGQPCDVTARGTLNSIRVEFADGYVMITSGNSIRRCQPWHGKALLGMEGHARRGKAKLGAATLDVARLG